MVKAALALVWTCSWALAELTAAQVTSSPILSSSPTPTVAPTEGSTTEGPVQEHLAVIIGVPTGVGLSILLIGSCVLWLACSSYLEHRRATAEHYGGTRTTHLNTSKGSTLPPIQSAATSDPTSEGGAFYKEKEFDSSLPRSPPPSQSSPHTSPPPQTTGNPGQQTSSDDRERDMETSQL